MNIEFILKYYQNKRDFTNDFILFLALCTNFLRFRIDANLIYVVFYTIFIIHNKNILISRNFIKILAIIIPFGIWATLTLFWSYEPYGSFGRGLFFIFNTIFAALIVTEYHRRIRQFFNLLALVNVIIIFFSILSLISGIPNDAWTANHGLGFTSIFSHQNSLAATLMFTLIGPSYLMMAIIKKVDYTVLFKVFQSIKKHPYFIAIVLLLLLNFLFIYLSYSRAVMFALFLGATVFLYLELKRKQFIIITTVTIIFGVILYNTFDNKIEDYLKKGGEDYFSRREILWGPSYYAALNGGFLGLGYGVTDPMVESDYKKNLNMFGNPKREKGSSILALVEETGFIGLILFQIPLLLVFVHHLVKHIVRQKTNSNNFKNKKNILENNIIIFFIVSLFIHAQIEAWWVNVTNRYYILYLILLMLYISKTIINFNSEEIVKNIDHNKFT